MVSRKKHAILGLFTDVSGTFILALVTFFATPLYLKYTSDSLYGFWLAAIAIVGYLALADFGLSVALTRSIAELSESSDSDSLNRRISTAFFTFCIAGCVFLLIGISFVAFLPEWFNMPADEMSIAATAYSIIVVTGAFALPLSVFSATVIGFQRMAFNNTVRLSATLISVATTLVLLYGGFGILSFAAAQALLVLITSAVSAGYAWRCFPQLAIRPKFANRQDLRELFAFASFFQFGKLARAVAVAVDPIVISIFLGAAVVTPYVMTAKLATLISSGLASKIPIALFPGLAQLFRSQDHSRIRSIYIKLTTITVRFAVVAAVCVAVLNREFVTLWVGESRFGGAALTAAFVGWILQDTFGNGTAPILVSSGKLRGWSLACLIEAGLNVAISCWLVMSHGLLGVAVATTIAKLLTTTWFVPYRICRLIDLPIRVYLVHCVIWPATKCLPGIGLTVAVAAVLPSHLGWLNIFFVGMVAGFSNLLFFEFADFVRQPASSWKERIRLTVTAAVSVT